MDNQQSPQIQLAQPPTLQQQTIDAMRNPAAFVAPLPQSSQPGTPQPAQPGTSQAPLPQPAQPGTSQAPLPQPAQHMTNDAYQQIIEQQQAQIDALMQQNAAQSAQIVQMVQGGAQFAQQPAQSQAPQVGQNWAVQPSAQAFPPMYGGMDDAPFSLAADVDVSLEGLAKEIGKKAE